MKITYLGHASFKINEDDFSIIFDPYQNGSVPGLVFPKGISSNKVFCSHSHHDHNAIDLVNIIPSEKEIEFKDLIVPHDKENGRKRGMNIAKILYFSSFSIAHLGDVGDISNPQLIDELKDVDIIFCPINGFYTISAKEAYLLKNKLPKSILIPMHYEDENGSYGYKDGGQIKIFKELFPNYLEVNNDTIDITDDLKKYDAVIFNKFKQGKGE